MLTDDKVKSRHLKQIIFAVLCLLLNIVLNNLSGFFGLPLYLDNVGNICAAAIGGYLPGICVGYLTNIINMPSNPDNAYYAVLSAMIAAAAAFLANRGFFNNLKKAILTVPIFAVIGGFFGSVLTYFMYGFGEGEGIVIPFAKGLLEKGSLSVFQAQILSDVSLDIIDKFITVIIAFIILKLFNPKLKKELRFTGWRQTPLTSEEVAIASHNETRSMSLRLKIVLIISIIMILVAVVTTAVSYLLYYNFSVEQYTANGRIAAKLASDIIDGDKIDEYLSLGEGSEDYLLVKRHLQKIKDSSDCIEYLYAYQIREDGCHVVFDLDSEDIKGESAGTVIPFDESFSEYIPALIAGEDIDPIITNDTYGWLLTDYEPVYDSSGKTACYVAADIQMRDVKTNSISFLVKTGSLFLGFFILILALCVWLANYHLLYTLSAMTMSARKFAFDSEEARDVSVERLQNLHIKTGDEIENLYESLSKTIAETAGYIEDVENKGEQIARMQNGLIYVLADLVESRDQNTGDHVRKTAAYVQLILNRMKEKGIYSDILTDEYINDVVHSAPLHDVGKIKISDTILNKPGKLSDDEYEIMKTHTTAGNEILASAISLVSDSGYLKEAKNLATYHHERWDGKGYPSRKAGEEIPLSARIMAIADVFDALVSRRSYKDPFPFDKAMQIIKEGAGTQFDPQLAQIFVEASDEVLQILKQHEGMLS